MTFEVTCYILQNMAKHNIMVQNSSGTLTTLENTITNTGTSTSDRWQVNSGDYIVFYFVGSGTFSIGGLNTTFWRNNGNTGSGNFTDGQTFTVQVAYGGSNTTDHITVENTATANLDRYWSRTITSDNYGLEIFGPNGTFIIFSSDIPQQNVLVTSLDNYTASQARSFTGITDATDATKIQVVVQGSQLSSQNGFTITRTTASGGTITVTNNTGTTQNGIATIISRIA